MNQSLTLCFNMVPQSGIEPEPTDYKSVVLPLYYKGYNLVLPQGIEPWSLANQARALPLDEGSKFGGPEWNRTT